jgi:hypothetical protein|tara:strand:+ start:962 stop:1348 length:387 start_codon:yes stop_codon:yes gene_type:complete
MIFNELNDDNYLIFAIKHYDNPQAVTYEDFLNDMKKFKYIKRLLKRYRKTGDLKSHLLINHFIVLYNVFQDATTPLLFYKIEQDLWSPMKTFIMFLGKLPEHPKSFIHDVQVDLDCLSQLNQTYNGKG